MSKKIQIIVIGILLAVLVLSVPVLAAEGDDVIILSDAEATDYVGITIDGYFSDWSDKPMSPIYYDSGTAHTGSLYRDEEYVYLYIRMSWPNYAKFNGYSYIFDTDNNSRSFDIVKPTGEITEGLNSMQVLRTSGSQSVPGASAYVLRTAGQADRMEMRIPLSYFPKQPDMITTITFHSPNLGSQILTATGTPTMPFLIAGSGLVIAGATLFIRKRKHAK